MTPSAKFHRSKTHAKVGTQNSSAYPTFSGVGAMGCLREFRVSCYAHYSDDIMSARTSQITCAWIVCSTVCSGAHRGNLKAPCYWPLWGASTGDRRIPLTKGAEMIPFDDVIMEYMSSVFYHAFCEMQCDSQNSSKCTCNISRGLCT